MAKSLEFLEQFQRVLTPVRCTTGPLEEQTKEKTKRQCTWVAWTNNQVIYIRCEKHGKWKTASWEIALGEQDGLKRKMFLSWCCKSKFDKKSISTVILTYCQAPPVV